MTNLDYLRGCIYGRLETLRESEDADNRMKCFHQGQIDAFEEVLEMIEELENDD